MTLVKVPENREEEFLKLFYDHSMFTFEGLDITNKNQNKLMEKTFREAGYNEKDFMCYHFSGATMNRVYGLTGDNAYPDDLTFVVVPEFYNIAFKMIIGARWFDDIVSNNRIKQNAIDSGINPDYDCIRYSEDEDEYE